jgi:putative transposase
LQGGLEPTLLYATYLKLSHVIWHCQFHIVWVPKYRYRVLNGKIGEKVRKNIIIQSERLNCEIVELSVQDDHVHLLIKVPPKIAISRLMGVLKGKTAIRVFNKFPKLKKRPYWGNHFWAEGYCVDTVGLDSEMIKKYVKYQEDK